MEPCAPDRAGATRSPGQLGARPGQRLTRPDVALRVQPDLRLGRQQVTPPELLPSPRSVHLGTAPNAAEVTSLPAHAPLAESPYGSVILTALFREKLEWQSALKSTDGILIVKYWLCSLCKILSFPTLFLSTEALKDQSYWRPGMRAERSCAVPGKPRFRSRLALQGGNGDDGLPSVPDSQPPASFLLLLF
jgi:hypothetical protein